MKNTQKTMQTIALISTFISLSANQANKSFFEKVEPIQKNLYKLSPEELNEIIGISSSEFPVITADQLKEDLESSNNLKVVNVLTKNYHDDCHIQGSVNAPLPELIKRAKPWSRSQKVVVYCALAECDASEKGCILLKCMGFTNVVEYKGGIKEWHQLQYPTVGPAVSDYLHNKVLALGLEYKLYPNAILCSMQTRWAHKYTA